MKKSLNTVFMLSVTIVLYGQSSFDKVANDAFVITRMVEKFHFHPKPLNNEFSIAVFDGLIKELDNEFTFFLQEDIKKLATFRLQIDEEVQDKKTTFLQLLSDIYKLRLQQVDTMINAVCKQPFNFNTLEKLTILETDNYPGTANAQKEKLRKQLKSLVLAGLLETFENDSTLKVHQKKNIDSLEAVYRKRVMAVFKRTITKELESPGGIKQLLAERYCEIIASYYDPHTVFLSLTNKDNFESELGQKTMMFGFVLDDNERGQVYIAQLKPGSPAYQSGQLNEGDKIKLIQWEGKAEIDVSDASLREIADILQASNHEKVIITVMKADESERKVTLAKAKMDDDSDDDKVKSFLLKGKKTVGYISLPAFYEDWENGESNVNGCANDVAREILKLKKENISALILDVRYNGGGSVQEAIELAGIFIDAGPVGQIKDKGTKTFTLKDVNRGTIYDGPLLLMVNGYSASASELIAATLQDYNRAVIIGSTTYGKATGQAVLPMDTTINMEKDFSNKETSSYLKLTLSNIYRVNGKTAQFAGVQPDIILPDIAEVDPRKEADEPFAIPPTGIEPNKYYKPLPRIHITSLQQYAKTVVDTSIFFKSLEQYIKIKKGQRAKRDISLNLKEAIEQRKINSYPDIPANLANQTIFSVLNNSYDEQRLQGNDDLKELHNKWKNFLLQDPYLQITFGIALMMIP